MTMPVTLVEVRHGQSEANIYQHESKVNLHAEPPEGFLDRHDSQMRLSSLGRWQADVTGEWLKNEFPDGFDGQYVSPHTRAIETAGRLALIGLWNIDDRVRERDWGEFGPISAAEQLALYALSRRLRDQSQWYWCPPGGESLGTGVRLRFEDLLDTLHREMADKAVLIATHGEFMDVSRAVLERLLPSEWEAQQHMKEYKLANCMVLEWSRRNPETGEISSHLEWRRAVCPWDPTRSWNEGQWVHLGPRKRFTSDQLREMAEAIPTLFPDESVSGSQDK